ncbi:RagB/SusD family nutrient uptake outer membrane protein [Arachidicoccus ginsenosidimutans]|uniref:RagB/SusD family nutrient uptake outer membrane protein n=1 Tax=Arachidicoccus sp. BS20 TaxID=1850526 RepID=UPI0018D2F006|nr:RagB/SusD family nutrient uptake outer membrane protein [Arachidicoccus sp. BS20]
MEKNFSDKYKIPVGSLLLIFSILVSCKKLIQIPGNPPTNITRQQAFADSATAMTTVAGAYSLTPGGAGLPYQDGSFTFATSLSGREINYAAGYGDVGQFYSYNVTPVNSEVNSIWVAHYKEIYQVNDILANIKDNPNLSASFIRQITGEMEFVRAFCYFNMVNLFGGVPLVTTTDYTTNARLPRATADSVYTQILADLEDAVKKLPATFPSAGHMRPNLYTATALLAKVHLYLGQWQAAYNEADSVIKSGDFSLLSNLNNVFLDGSNEAVWQVPILNIAQGSSEAGNFLPYSNTTTPNYVITDSLLDQFEANDLRKVAWLGVNVVNSQNVYYPAKYKDRYPTTPATDYMLLRYADIILIRAEAAAQLNNLSQAVMDINIIRTRAGLPGTSADPTSQSAVLAAIRKERRTEMFTEFGSRWFDLNRTSADTKYPASTQAPAVLDGWTENAALYPIPQTQISLNNTLTQNPGYH